MPKITNYTLRIAQQPCEGTLEWYYYPVFGDLKVSLLIG